jgi:glycosyltransferase involved in cell wall biosynthesis
MITVNGATMSGPRLTIALPVYNGARFLEKTLGSLLDQSFRDFELLIGDNASTDATSEIARAAAARDERIEYLRHPRNLGLAGNYNALARRASGELFKWAPADDYYAPSYLERCVEALDEDHHAVLAYPVTIFVDENDHPLPMSDPGFQLRGDSALERLLYVIRAGHWVNALVGVIRSTPWSESFVTPRSSALTCTPTIQAVTTCCWVS